MLTILSQPQRGADANRLPLPQLHLSSPHLLVCYFLEMPRLEKLFLTALKSSIEHHFNNLPPFKRGITHQSNFSKQCKLLLLRNALHQVSDELKKENASRMHFSHSERMELAKLLSLGERYLNYQPHETLDLQQEQGKNLGSNTSSESQSYSDTPNRIMTTAEISLFVRKVNIILKEVLGKRITPQLRNTILDMWRNHVNNNKKDSCSLESSFGEASSEGKGTQNSSNHLSRPEGKLLKEMMDKTGLRKPQIIGTILYYQQKGQITKQKTRFVKEWLRRRSDQLPIEPESMKYLQRKTNLNHNQVYHLIQRLLPQHAQTQVSSAHKEIVREAVARMQGAPFTDDDRAALVEQTGLSRKKLRYLIQKYSDPPGTLTKEVRDKLENWFVVYMEQRGNQNLSLHERIPSREYTRLQQETQLSKRQIQTQIERLKKLFAEGKLQAERRNDLI